MFVEFYGLCEDPFSLWIPRYIYLGVSHRKALASLHYGVEYGGGFQLLLADRGLGKTTLLRYLQRRVQTYRRTVFLSSADCKEHEFLSCSLTDLGVDKPDRVLRPHQESINEPGTADREMERRFLLLVDDVQDLNDSALESVLALAKLEAFEKKQLHIVLAGRPELLEKLKHSNLAFQQIWITPLDAAEIAGYIDHRLQMAGRSEEPIFTPAACALIAKQSEGIPKRINNICLAALKTGATSRLRQIDTSNIGRDEADYQILMSCPPPEPSIWRRIPPKACLLITLASFMATAIFLYATVARILQTEGVAVNETASLPKSTPRTVAQNAPLRQSTSTRSKVPIAPRIQAGKPVAPGELISSTTTGNVTRGPLIPTTPAASRQPPRTTFDHPIPIGAAAIPTGAVAAIPTPPTRLRNTPTAKLASSELQSSLNRKPPSAAIALRNAVTADKYRTRVQTDIGDDYMRLGQYDKALNFYEHALDFSPGNEQLQQKMERARRAKATEEQVLSR